MSFISILIAILISCLCAVAVASFLAKRGFPVTPNTNRIGCVDGLRGYLALFVLFHHFIIYTEISKSGAIWAAPTTTLFNSFGSGAVSLFFMVTGLVFTPKIRAGFAKTSWVRVYISRAFRILPLGAVSIAIITVIIMLRTGKPLDASYFRAAASWIFSQGQPPLLGYAESGKINAYVLWSLKYEWLFYIFVLPTCALAMDLMKGKHPSWVLPLAILVLSLAIKPFLKKAGLFSYLPFFAFGMIAYECASRASIVQFFKARWVPFMALACLLAGLLSEPSYGVFQLFSYGLFFISIASGTDLWGLLRLKFNLLLGECSFGIYLLHGIVLNVLSVDFQLFNAADYVLIFMPIAVIITVLVSAVAHIAIERPAINLAAINLGRLAKF